MVMTKEERKQYNKKYHQSPKGKMCNKIANWKQKTKNGYGLICENKGEYEYIYDRWLRYERCEECSKKYNEDNWKCMDHCHLTGLFRDILCHSCNMKRQDNSSGISNISKHNNGWLYQITIKGNKHSKYSKDLEFLKEYKIEYEKKYLYNI